MDTWIVAYLLQELSTRMLVDKRIIFGHSKPDSLQDILVHMNIFGEKRYVINLPLVTENGNANIAKE